MIRDERLRRQEPKRVVAAIKRLGELKAVAAVGDLVELLAFGQPLDFETADATNEVRLIATGDRYPATSALFQIGKPALPALVRVIADKDVDATEFKNARDAVMSIFREDLPGGSSYLRAEATKASSSVAERRLLAAAQWIDDLHAKIKAAYGKPK